MRKSPWVRPALSWRLLRKTVRPSSLRHVFEESALLRVNVTDAFSAGIHMLLYTPLWLLGASLGMLLALLFPALWTLALLPVLHLMICMTESKYMQWRLMPGAPEDLYSIVHRARYPHIFLSGVFMVLMITSLYRLVGGGQLGDMVLVFVLVFSLGRYEDR